MSNPTSSPSEEPKFLFKNPNEKPTTEELAKLKIGHDLGIACERPYQSKRILALYQLFTYYFFRSDTRSYIALKIVEIAERLRDIYKDNISLLQDYVSSSKKIHLTPLKEFIDFVNYKDLKEFREGEEQINFFKQLMYFYDQKKEGKMNLSTAAVKLNISALKKIEEEAFECWLRLLDVNYELRNTIIGAENRKAIYHLSHKYVDLHTIIDQLREDSLDDLEKLRESTVKDYYETMRYFSLPANKLLNFRLFLQKKLESRMYEAQFLKLQSGNTMKYELSLLDDNCSEFRRQYLLSLKEITSIVNYYKTTVIRHQTFFGFELEKLVNYLRESYLNLINLIFKNLKDHKSFLEDKKESLTDQEIEIALALEKEKLESSLSEIRTRYSSVLVPLINSFNGELERQESRNCFNTQATELRYFEIKDLKNKTIEAFVKRFELERDKIQTIVEDKKQMLENLDEKITEDTQNIVDKLREECSVICSDLLRENQYFWARFNAEFNSVSRKYLVKLYYEYSPYINSWNDGDEGWMKEYLKLKINSEYLRKIGTTVKEFSPEGVFYEKSSRLIGSYLNFFRNICIQRDRVELDCLLKLNTVPRVDYLKVQEKLDRSLSELEESHNSCVKLVNELLSK